MFSDSPVENFCVSLAIFVIAVTLHEAGHAYMAYWCGDDTPRLQGRLSFNPIDHLDPLGTIMMIVSSLVGFGIGWGKPVMYLPANLRHPRWDVLKIAVAGPFMNLVQMLFFTLVLRLGGSYNWFGPDGSQEVFLHAGIFINLSLIAFNLIPIPPLDGSKVLAMLLPYDSAKAYDRTMATIGFPLFMILAFTRVFNYTLLPLCLICYGFLAGPY